MTINILFASSNQGKIQEFNNYFSNTAINFIALQEQLSEDTEDGNTFLENASKKTEATLVQYKNINYQETVDYILADDSGLCVESMNNQPGIYSARYFDNGQGMHKIISELQNNSNRNAYFVCTLVLINASTGELVWSDESHWHGQIAGNISGTNGFGYDPIFIPEGYNCTVAELPAQEKNTISHRAQAMYNLKEHLLK